MSDETKDQPITDAGDEYSKGIDDQENFQNHPDLRTVGRGSKYRRRGLSGRPTEVLREARLERDELAARVKQLEDALVRAQDAKVTPNLFFPPPPPEYKVPEGFEFIGETISRSKEDGKGDVYSTFVKVLPPRGDDKRLPDPRFCVFCSKSTLDLTKAANPNVCTMYGYDDITDAPTKEQEVIIKRLHIQHMEAVKAMRQSDLLEERRMYADHFDLKFSPRGPVKDEVAFRSSGRKSGVNKSYSAEEMNKIRQAEYQALCNSIVMNRAR